MKPNKRAIRKTLKAHRGSAKKLAEELGLKPAAISNWLSGRTVSARLDSEVPGALDRIVRGSGGPQ